MEQTNLKVYGHRWLILLAFMFIAGMNQMTWITFAPITSKAVEFFGLKSDLMVSLLSMSFMAVGILLVIPAAWVIDTWGFRVAVGIGAALTGFFAMTRGIFAHNFSLVFASQIGLAVAQPFILGAITKLAARWFPVKERATAAGLGTLSTYLGIMAAMIITPPLTLELGIPGMLLAYGVASLVAAFFFLFVARERPPTSPAFAGVDDRVLMFEGLKRVLRQRDFIFLLIIFFFGLGAFNAISTWIEVIVHPRGFSIAQAGMAGGLMLIGGICGAIAMPILSDTFHRRKPFMITALAGVIPGLIGMTFATNYWLLLASGFIFGFFLLGSGPIGFQYAAEITRPAPEGTSNSLLLAMGQISGIIFIFGMDALKAPGTGVMTNSLLGQAGLIVLSLILVMFLRESPILASSRKIEQL
ncbi:MAG: MFS transporter [Patescibacteria group bacterium]|jgi:MFS family permease